MFVCMEIQDLYYLFLEKENVSTDTRNIIKDSIFFALKGENFDANQFAQQALDNGASYAIVDDKNVVKSDKFILVDAYKIIDPTTYTQVYNDMFLKRYLTQLFKRQWGSNLIKFEGMQLPGGVTMNGRQLYDDAIQEIQRIEEEMQLRYQLPDDFMVG